MRTDVVDEERDDEQVVAFVDKDEHRLLFRTDHTGCCDEAIWRHDRVTAWRRLEGYEGWVLDGTCPTCRRLYRMWLSNHLLLEAMLT